MPRKPTRKAPVCTGVAIFMAALTAFVAMAALAQMTNPRQPVAQVNGYSLQQSAAHPRGPIEGSGHVQRVSAGRLEGNKAALASPDSSNPLLLPAVLYDSPNADALAVGDLNRDGRLDLVVANSFCSACGGAFYGTVSVLLGNGDGTFQTAVVYEAGGPAREGASSIAIADVNGDGKLDLVVTTECGIVGQNCPGNGSATVLLGNGDGTFQSAVNYDSGAFGADSVVVADVNGDGKLDLVVANSCGGGVVCSAAVSVLLGNGDGTFQSPATYSSSVGGGNSVAVADVNGDGKLDLLVSYAYDCDCQNGVTGVLLGNGDGTFTPGASYNQVGGGSVTVADVNGDHKLDLLVTTACENSGVCSSGTVGVLLGKGDGTFQPQVTYSSGGTQAASVAVADFNGDGKPDLLVENGCSIADVPACETGTVGVLLGNGDGTFQSAITFGSGGGYAVSIAAGDLNGDGRIDVAVANGCGGSSCDPGGGVSVLLNNTGPHSPSMTVLASSANPSLAGRGVTFTAVVSAASGTVSGTVIFFDGSTAIGSAALSSGSASVTISSLTVGSHSITAVYQGSLTLSGSTSAPLTQIVHLATTTTTLTSSPNPLSPYEVVGYYATVSTEDGEGALGTVTFQDNGVTIAVVNLSYNRAVCSASYKTAGIHSVTAIYSGDTDNSPSKSATLTEVVIGASQTKLISSGSPTLFGQPVTFTATVISHYGTIPNGELVTFYDGKTMLASMPLTGGTASYTTSSLSAKTHAIKATYSGDPTFKPSTAVVSQVVNKYSTTTTLSSSLNPSAFGKAVTFTAVVTSAGPYPPTGKVTFWDGTLRIGSVTLSGGLATVTKSTLAVGTHPITAQYLGDAASVKSTSALLEQVVQ